MGDDPQRAGASPPGEDRSGVPCPALPGTGATALHLAMAMLQGGELDEAQLQNGHDIVLELEEPVTAENFDEVWG